MREIGWIVVVFAAIISYLGYMRELPRWERLHRARFRETAEGIPNARLIIYEGRAHGGTLADRRFGRDVAALLLPRASLYNS